MGTKFTGSGLHKDWLQEQEKNIKELKQGNQKILEDTQKELEAFANSIITQVEETGNKIKKRSSNGKGKTKISSICLF